MTLLNAKSLTRLGVTGKDGRTYKIVAGTLRNDGGPSYFQPIVNATHAANLNIDSVTTSSGGILVDHTSIGATRLVSMVVCADETFAGAGLVAGCSVGLTSTYIQFTRLGVYADYVSYSGSAWVSQTNVFTPTFSAGKLTLTHPSLNPGPGTGIYDIAVTGRGGTYVPVVSGTSGSILDNSLAIEFRDFAGTLVTTADVNMKVFVSHGASGVADATKLDTVQYPGSNVWMLGLFEV